VQHVTPEELRAMNAQTERATTELGNMRPSVVATACLVAIMAQGPNLIAVCQALELRGVQNASPGTQAARELVRARVPFLDGDRRMDADIAAIVGLIRSGELSRIVSGP
jgi:histidine ammonia-lyase